MSLTDNEKTTPEIKTDEIFEQTSIGDIQLKEGNANANFCLKNSGTIIVLTTIEK